MRVIAGTLGGRTFDSPSGHKTHPMSEKVRGAIFNALGDISGLNILDAYSGSGALSIEAISRGAALSVAIDSDKRAVATIVTNVNSLGLQKSIKAIQANITGWSANNPDALFDLVISDPPYDGVKPEALAQVARHAHQGAVIVFSLPPDTIINLPFSEFEPLAQKQYGDASLVFYRRIS